MNSVQLIGRLTRDPEVHVTSGGSEVCRMGIAISRRNSEAEPVFVEVKAWGSDARACGEYLAKGNEVAVSGRMETDRWEAEDGSRRSLTYVVAFPGGVDFLRRPRPTRAAPVAAQEGIAAAAA